MYATVDNFDKKINLYAEEEDSCYICANMEMCPLIAALQDEAVILRYENIEVGKCAMYKEYTLGELIAF